jgi:hypothetical protein
MAVGENALMGFGSYVAIGRESTYGTYVTGTAGLAFLSASLKVTKETKILEEVQRSRTNSNFIQLGKTIEGDIEYYHNNRNLACNYLLQNAFGGGPVTSATATGDTAGAVSFTHQIDISDFKSTYSSLSINMRKGDSAGAKIFEYKGLRVNEFSLAAEIDEPLVATVSLVGQDVSLTSNDVSASLDTVTSSYQNPLSFVSGRISIENSTASLTSTSFWHVQSMEFKISNNLNADTSSRRIGTDTLQVLPPGLANFEFNCTLRFDTTTALSAMLNGTRLVGEFEFLGDTLTGSSLRESLKITMPYLIVNEAGDPEVGGPSEVLTSQVSFAVLRDPTTSGYAVRAVVRNATSSYA